MATRLDRDKEWLRESLAAHKGKWLTQEDVVRYQKLAKNIPDSGGQMIGERRKLCLQLMEKFGVSELEAVNIISGKRGMDYVAKYERIRTQTPLKIQNDKVIKAEDLQEKARDELGEAL